MAPENWWLVYLGVLVLILLSVTGLAITGYRRLKIGVNSIRITPEFQFHASAVIGAIVGIVTHNFLGAMGNFLSGAKLEGKLTCKNHALVPLFLPASEHRILIEGVLSQQVISVPAFWLKPGDEKTFPLCLKLAKGNIPQILLTGIGRLGEIKVEIHSRAMFGPLSCSRTTFLKPSLTRSLSRALTKKPLKEENKNKLAKGIL